MLCVLVAAPSTSGLAASAELEFVTGGERNQPAADRPASSNPVMDAIKEALNN